MAVDVQPNELRDRLRAGEDVFVLDVREPEEVADWAFPGAVNIPLGETRRPGRRAPTDRPIVVVCHSGVRSTSAADALATGGWSAENLAGGAVAWLSTEPTV